MNLKIIKYKLLQLKQRFVDYWFGSVSVLNNYIYCADKVKRVDSIDIVA